MPLIKSLTRVGKELRLGVGKVATGTGGCRKIELNAVGKNKFDKKLGLHLNAKL